MLAILIGILVGLLGGAAAGLQAPFAGLMGKRLGDLESVFFTYAGGGLVIALIIFLFARGGNISAWRNVPWYVFAAGPLGLVVIASLSYTVPRLGTAAATTLFVAAWLVLSATIDHFGWFDSPLRPLDLTRIAGIIALFIGTWLMVR